jgi:hypothetical protein
LGCGFHKGLQIGVVTPVQTAASLLSPWFVR